VHADGIADLDLLERAVAEMRGWGWAVVLADVADEPHGLAALAKIRPDVVQVDLGRSGGTASPAVGRFLAEAHAAGAAVMALGIDSPARRAAAATVGATLGRGLLLGTPGPLPI
jgi:EAL domain-containing protein (putative c-di-GMP-specific phosphodiesterase class I)